MACRNAPLLPEMKQVSTVKNRPMPTDSVSVQQLNRILAISGFVALTLASPMAVYCQELMWETGYGGLLNDVGYGMYPVADNGVVLAGSTFSFGAGDYDTYVLRLDSLGDTLWSVTWGGSSSDHAYDIASSADDGFVVVGSTQSFGNGNRDVCLFKVSGTGHVMWTRSFGGTSDDTGNSVRCLPDSGFIIAGTTSSSGAGYDDILLIRTDKNGLVRWQRTYGGTGGETGMAVRTVAGTNPGYIVVGSTGSFGDGYSSIYAIRTDTLGDTIWTATYGGSRADIGQTVEIAADGGFLFAGATASYGSGFYDCYVARTDADGVLQWQNWYGGAKDDRCYAVAATPDHGWILAGTTESSGAGKIDILLTRISDDGEPVWSRTIGGTESDYARAVVPTADGNTLAAGYSYSYSYGGSDVYVVKIRGDAMTAVFEQSSSGLPAAAALEQNYPNPFNASTTITFDLTIQSAVELAIYNVLGRTVKRFTQNLLPAGRYRVEWDGTDDHGRPVASGVYLYRLSTGSASLSKKMVLVK